MRSRAALGIVFAVTLGAATACATGAAQSQGPEQQDPLASGDAAAPDRTFVPGPHSVSGKVVRLLPEGIVVVSGDEEVEISLASVEDVWKETYVGSKAIEVGDSVFVNGTAASPFVARHVTVNIGRVDGTLKSVDSDGMMVDVRLRTGNTVTQRIEFSKYVEYGAADRALTRDDLAPGLEVGMVVYRPPVGHLRATRIWSPP